MVISRVVHSTVRQSVVRLCDVLIRLFSCSSQLVLKKGLFRQSVQNKQHTRRNVAFLSTRNPLRQARNQDTLDSQLMVRTATHSNRWSAMPSSVSDDLFHFFQFRPATAPFTSTSGRHLNFTALVSKSSRTRWGIDIKQEIRSEATTQLTTLTDMAATTSLCGKGFHYSCLDFDVTMTTSSADVDQLIELLKRPEATGAMSGVQTCTDGERTAGRRRGQGRLVCVLGRLHGELCRYSSGKSSENPGKTSDSTADDGIRRTGLL
ncbi:uncharacterized protein LOC135366575 isoform X1 [Ornithodoros turicata]|uniref:uncharacterized protein LOC135366575 isoform X1 n=1 Tax=Ornithodoros turicata TaxID=34597 RepID=UPI003138C55A